MYEKEDVKCDYRRSTSLNLFPCGWLRLSEYDQGESLCQPRYNARITGISKRVSSMFVFLALLVG